MVMNEVPTTRVSLLVRIRDLRDGAAGGSSLTSTGRSSTPMGVDMGCRTPTPPI